MHHTSEIISQAIPVFKFGSKELESWKKNFLKSEEQVVTYRPYQRHFELGLLKNLDRMVWGISGVKYILDHGSFKTLETSVAMQQLTISENIF